MHQKDDPAGAPGDRYIIEKLLDGEWKYARDPDTNVLCPDFGTEGEALSYQREKWPKVSAMQDAGMPLAIRVAAVVMAS